MSAFKTMIVFTHPSGQDLVMDVFDEINESQDQPVLSVSHAALGEFEVRALPSDLARTELLLRSITGVRCVR